MSHQKVSIDVDLEANTISGYTELTVNSYQSILRHIKLDCRQVEIKSVLVNQRRALFHYQDPLKDELETITNPEKKPFIHDIEQHHIYKGKMKKIYTGENTDDLTIFIPEGLHLQQQEYINSRNTPNGYRDSPGSHKATHTHPEVQYKALTVRIDFSVKNPQSGVHFVGGKDSQINRSEWHAYTSNNALGVSTSSWLPCVDNIWEKPTWEFEISVPKTVKQIGVSNVIGADVVMGGEDDEDDQDDSNEIVVIGADFSSQTETAHPVDFAKKLVMFQVLTPTAAHHAGWAVGPFVQTPLINLAEENQPETVQEKDTTAVPSAVYCLPSQVDDAVNSTIFLYKTIDFYSREFGSYPYISYAMVFVSDLDVEFNGFGGLSILSNSILYPATAIEPIYDTTYTLSLALAEQWSGIYLVPKTYSDIWTTIGISHFMTLQFIRRLMGTNEYKYRVKKQSEKICDQDVGKPPLSDPYFRFPITMIDLDFIKLKAPVVMFILDRRMTKTDKSFGLTRVIPKIFVQAMSGDLPNGCLSTQHFQHVCEKVGHNKLESFFRQWVHGCGVPIFRVSQRFNKKRMFIEMGIRQVQNQETEKLHPDGSTFISEATRELEDSENQYTPSLFTGPMTIRIHEADGTPYEHIVDLKEGFTKLDIQYNTKYKRLKRSQKQIKSDKEAKENAEEDETVLLHCLGDILQTENDVKNWNLTEWTKEEEEKMTNEAFEWIRVDADFEWICKIHLNQPDYMYASQLQQDRDVEAQVESIQYFANSNASALYSSILLRTLMDSRYYYGVRIEAAMGIAKFAKEQIGSIGSKHLLKAFKTQYCFENSNIPLPNDFSDFSSYLIKKGIISSLSTVRDSNGNCPLEIRKFLLDLLKFNQNLNNPFTDSYYICHLMTCIVDATLANPLHDSLGQLNDADKKFLDDVVDELSRHQKMTEWLPSNDGSVGVNAIKNKLRLSRRALLKITPEELLSRTKASYPENVRVLAFRGLFDMGGLKNETILQYFLYSTLFERSLKLKHKLISSFIQSIGSAVVNGAGDDLDEDELSKDIVIEEKEEPQDSGFVVVEESGSNKAAFETRRDAAARATLTGAIDLLRRDYSGYKPLRDVLWNAVRHPLLGLVQKRDLFDLIYVLIPAYDTLEVSFAIPREKKITASNQGDGLVSIKRGGLLKLTLVTKVSGNGVTVKAPAPATTKPAAAKAKSLPKIILKPSSSNVATSQPSTTAPNIPRTAHYKATIKRSESGPLRYVKIDRRNKNIIVSANPLKVSKPSKKVTLRLPSEKLRIATSRSATPVSTPQSKKQSLSFTNSASPDVKLNLPAPKTAPSSDDAPKPKLKLKFKAFK